jgi:hypothetical protein
VNISCSCWIVALYKKHVAHSFYLSFDLQLWVGVIISQQSFFIAGLEDADEAKNSAFGAMGMFAFTFVASIAGIWYDSNYKQEPIAEEEAAEGYQLSTGDTPTYGTSS